MTGIPEQELKNIKLTETQLNYLLWNKLFHDNLANDKSRVDSIQEALNADIDVYAPIAIQKEASEKYGTAGEIAVYFAGTSVIKPEELEARKMQSYQPSYDALNKVRENFAKKYANKPLSEALAALKEIARDPTDALKAAGVQKDQIDRMNEMRDSINSKTLALLNNFDPSEQDLANVGYVKPQVAAAPAVVKKNNPPSPPVKTAPKQPVSAATTKNDVIPPTPDPSGKPVIALDIGHGWTGEADDPGALSKKGDIQEHPLALNIVKGLGAKSLKAKLEKMGFWVDDTSDETLRPHDKGIDNFASRKKIAKVEGNQAHRDAFLYISNHIDGNDTAGSLGICCYYDKEEKNKEDVTALADLISQHCCSIRPPVEKTDRRAPISGLGDTRALLIEWGNIKDEKDLANLQDENWIDEQTTAVAHAIKAHYDEMRRKNPALPELVPEPDNTIQPTPAPTVASTPAPTPAPVVASANDFKSSYTPDFSGSNSEENGAGGFLSGDVMGNIAKWAFGPNKAPATSLLNMIIQALFSLFGFFKIGEDNKIADKLGGEDFYNKVTADINSTLQNRFDELGLDTQNNRYEYSDAGFVKFTDAKEQFIKESSEFLNEEIKKYKGKPSADEVKNILEGYGKWLKPKIEELSKTFTVDDFTPIPLEKDGKDAFYDMTAGMIVYKGDVSAGQNLSAPAHQLVPLKDINSILPAGSI